MLKQRKHIIEMWRGAFPGPKEQYGTRIRQMLLNLAQPRRMQASLLGNNMQQIRNRARVAQ